MAGGRDARVRLVPGQNDLHTSLIDPDTGGCLDGLHSDRANQNMGAESALSYLLGLVEIRQFEHTTAKGQTKHASTLLHSVGDRSTAP